MAIVDLGQEYVKAADASDVTVTIQARSGPGMEVIFSAGGIPESVEMGLAIPALGGVVRGDGVGHTGHIYVRALRLPGAPAVGGVAVVVIG